MDFIWSGWFWVFPALCLAFMILMAIICSRVGCRCCCGLARRDNRERAMGSASQVSEAEDGITRVELGEPKPATVVSL